jgi:hypothetical protein
MAAAVNHCEPRERRQFERVPVGDDRRVRALIRAGRDVRLVDLSRGGALIQAASRLLPGSQVELQLTAGEWRWSSPGAVSRCRVWLLPLDERVLYRAALQFLHPMERGTQAQLLEALGRGARRGGGHLGYELPAEGSADPGAG